MPSSKSCDGAVARHPPHFLLRRRSPLPHADAAGEQHTSRRFDMTMKDTFAYDRSLNGNHTPACALPTRGGVCDCWPPTTDSLPWGQPSQSSDEEPSEDTINGLGRWLVA